MKDYKYTYLAVLIFVIFAAGIIGFSSYEDMSTADALRATIGAVTFTGDTSSYGSQAQLLNSALSLTAIVLIMWAFVNFHYNREEKITDPAREYFQSAPPDETVVIREVRISAGSHLAGRNKAHVLQATGAIVYAIRKGKNFQLNVPFEKRLAANTSILVLGEPTQLNEVEKKATQKKA